MKIEVFPPTNNPNSAWRVHLTEWRDAIVFHCGGPVEANLLAHRLAETIQEFTTPTEQVTLSLHEG